MSCRIREQYFNSIFPFENDEDWILPKNAYKRSQFVINELQDIKRRLDNVKNKLDKIDLNEWSRMQHDRNIAGKVYLILRNEVKAELLTQSWSKFYEMVHKFPIVQSSKINSFRSFHLGEAGSFICALNHYLVQNHTNEHWQWVATRFNPNYEGTLSKYLTKEDRLLINIKGKFYLFGADQTGDITKYYNHLDLVSKVNTNGEVSLVTADGTIECADKYSSQKEKLVAFLHYCETMTALKILQTGGSFLLKIFTVFEHTTICLLYLLNCVFQEVKMYKPFASRAGNSELYAVCLGYYGIEKLTPIWSDLIKPYENGGFFENISMFSFDEIPLSFRHQVLECAKYFFLKKQIRALWNNVEDYHKKTFRDNDGFKFYLAHLFKETFDLQKIPKDKKVVPHANLNNKDKNSVKTIKDYLNRKISVEPSMLNGLINIIQGHRISSVEQSNFISTEKLEELSNYILSDTVGSSPPLLYERILKHLQRTCIVININQFTLSPNYIYQKKLFRCLLEAIKQRKNLLLINVPFHTHFLAGLWCILASGFRNIRILGVGGVLFHEPLSSLNNYVLDCFSQIEDAYNNLTISPFPSDILYLLDPYEFKRSLKYVNDLLIAYNNSVTLH